MKGTREECKALVLTKKNYDELTRNDYLIYLKLFFAFFYF